jgi:MraZ protein
VDDVSLDDRNTRWFKRTFYSGAREVSCDQQGRVLLPQVLAKYAGISKEVVIVGLSDFIEVWDAEAWDSWLAQSMDSYEKIAEKLIESAAPGKESTNETATNS